MARICPAHLDARRFTNIDEDALSAAEVRDEVITLLGSATDAAHAKVLFEEWRAKTTSSRVASHAFTFETGERVGRLRYRPNYSAQLADLLSSQPLLDGVDESDVDELQKW